MSGVETWAERGMYVAGIGAGLVTLGLMAINEERIDIGIVMPAALAGGLFGAVFGALTGWVAGTLGPKTASFAALSGFIGVLAAIVATPSSMPYDEHLVRAGIVGSAWWLVAAVLGAAAAGFLRITKRAGGAAVTLGSGLVQSVQRKTLEARLDEIEALYAAGKISDVERAEARARLLVGPR